jgi:hypothetical protein
VKFTKEYEYRKDMMKNRQKKNYSRKKNRAGSPKKKSRR